MPHPNIVFLDSRSLNPGDLSWEGLEQCGHFTAYPQTSPDEIVSRAQDADIILLNKVPLTRETFLRLPRLRLVCVAATGYDVVDVKAARELGISVCNCAGYGTMAVAQMVVAHLLELTNKVGHYAEAVRTGYWCRSADFCCWDEPLTELEGKRIAVVGYGNIGSKVLEILRTFGMKLAAVTSRPQDRLPEDIHKLTVQEAFSSCDVVCLCCPLTSENKRFVNAGLLAQSKPGLVIVNTARGKLVDEEALARFLEKGHIGAYLADVLSEEPPREDNPLLSAPRTQITPHIAWATAEARQRILDMIIRYIRSYISGQRPEGVVN